MHLALAGGIKLVVSFDVCRVDNQSVEAAISHLIAFFCSSWVVLKKSKKATFASPSVSTQSNTNTHKKDTMELFLQSTVSLLVLCLGTTSAFQVVTISPFQQQYNKLSTTTTTTTATSSSSSSTKLSMSNFIDINEYTAARDIGTFDEWSTNCGVQRSDGFQIVESETNTGDIDYSIITTEPIPGESPVLFVSNEMIFTSENVRAELVGQNLGLEDAEQLLEKLGVPPSYFSQYHLFLKILIEYQNGSDSPWYPWLNSLPRKFSNGSSMTRKF